MSIHTVIRPLVFIAIAACNLSPNYFWWKDGVSEKQMSLDQAQCEYESRTNTPPVYIGGLPAVFVEKKRIVDLYVLCLQARGYNRVPLNPSP